MGVIRTEKLRSFTAKLEGLRAEQLRRDLAPALRGTVMKLVADEFRQERDPYGKPWAPLKRERRRNRNARRRGRRGGQKILQNTGRMRAAASVRAEDGRLVVSIPVAYSSFHQEGTRKMVARKMVPDVGDSPIWREALRRDSLRFLRDRMGG